MLDASRLATHLVLCAASAAVTQAAKRSSKPNVIIEVGSLCASGSGYSSAQPWFAMPTVVARALKTPTCHDGCEDEEQPSRQVPMRNAAMRRAHLLVRLPPDSPQTPPAKLSWSVLKAPALTRLQDGTCTAPTLGAGWCRVIPMQDRDSTVSSVARLLRFFDRLPTGSFQQQIRPFLTRRRAA